MAKPKILKTLGEIRNNDGTLLSCGTSYSEVREWSDGNTSNEDRTGYFVTICNTTANVSIMKATSNTCVRGVTVNSPGFSCNVSADKYEADGCTLLPKYSYVAFTGIVPIRIDSTITEADVRCMPNDSGIATLSTNDFGYRVIEIIDSTHAMILVEQQTDNLQRLKSAVNILNNAIASFEETKSDIVGSSLGGALSLTSDSKWADVVSAILRVADRGYSQFGESVGNGDNYFAIRNIPEGYYHKNSKYSWTPEIKINKDYFGDAVAANVLKGKHFTSTAGLNVSGTMPNKGNLNWAPNSSTSYTVPAGYYSGGTLNSANAYNAGVSAGNLNMSNKDFAGHSGQIYTDGNSSTHTVTWTAQTAAVALIFSVSFNHGGTPGDLSIRVTSGSIASQKIFANNTLVQQYQDRNGGLKVFSGVFLLNANTTIQASITLGGSPGGGYVSIIRIG